MLEVLGYRSKEVRQFVMTSDHLLVPIGFVVGVPLGYLTAYSIMAASARSSGMYMGLPVKAAHHSGKCGNRSGGICTCSVPVRQKAEKSGYGRKPEVPVGITGISIRNGRCVYTCHFDRVSKISASVSSLACWHSSGKCFSRGRNLLLTGKYPRLWLPVSELTCRK